MTYIERRRPENNERQLLIKLTGEGEALKEKAVKVPAQMAACIDLHADEMMQMKKLLEKALVKKDTTYGKIYHRRTHRAEI